MINPFTLPALGGSLLASVAIGIALGESAVGLIDPIHFQGPAVHPRDRGAAIDPNRVRPRPAAYGDLYGWEEGHAARAADCGDCPALAARAAYAYASAPTYSAEVPYFGGSDEPRAASRRGARAEPAPVAPSREEWASREQHVARYAGYPVSAEEAAYPDYKARDVHLPAGGDGAARIEGFDDE